jgi:hypothetical protein
MIYQNPLLLYALFAIAIPILIHLFNFRKYKKIYFSSIRFLKEIKEENKKKSDLRNILVLLSRILAICFLVLAFAKPYIPSNTAKNYKDIFLYIDNSQSMNIDFGEGNLLNNAKNKAIEIIEAYPSEKNFYLLTNDFESKHISSYNIDLIKLQVEKVESSPKSRSISSVISRINSISSSNSYLYFISDFQEKTIKIEDLKELDISNNISLVPIENKNPKNICIDSLYTLRPILQSDNLVEIHVIISNKSNEEIIDDVLFLYLDDKQKSQQYINLLANETKEVVFNFLNTGNTFINGEIRTQDNHITFDNNLFFSLTKSKKINVTVINNKNENKAFNALFGNDTATFNFVSLKLQNINHNALIKQDFIIINELEEVSSGLLNTLLSFTNNGGSLLVVPKNDLVNFKDYNFLLKSLGINTISSKIENELKINQFSTNHSIYKNVFSETLKKVNYPISKKNYCLNKQKISTQIIGLANKQDFLSEYSIDKGTIYQFSSPLNISYNNFTNHALFVPTLINMASSAILINTPYYIIGSDKEISTKFINNSTGITHIKGQNIDIIPTVTNKNGKQLLNYHNQINKNGIYSLITNNQIVDKIAFNYNTSESILGTLTTDEILDYINSNNIKNVNVITTENLNLKKIIKEQEIGKEYWKIAILLSLLFFALEILLLKMIKL